VLTSHWRPTFAEKTIDTERAEKFLKTYGKRYDTSDAPALNTSHYLAFFKTLRDNGVGPDGLPYSAWTAGEDISAQTLLGVSDEMHSARPICASFNDSRLLFLKKGEKDDDDICCVRAPHETRPLGLKNSDNKIVTGVRMSTLTEPMKKNTHHTQRGFVPGRQLLQNALDLDAASRIFSNQACDYNKSGGSHEVISATPLFDFTAAFPSVSHEWIELVMRYRGFSHGLRNFFWSLYYMNCAVESDEQGCLVVLFVYLSGVLQGCTASGFLFDMGIDPFLQMMDEQVAGHGRGIVRACADDIGAALRDYRELRYLYEPFQIAESCAGLTLQPKKCKIIVTSQLPSEKVVHVIRSWLLRTLPNWRNFHICGSASYVGLVIGPTAGANQWRSCLEKYISGCKAIGASGVAVSVAAHSYNTRVAPLLAYKSQLVPLDESATKTEIYGLQKVLHVATNALSHNAFFNLSAVGGPALKSIRVQAKAAMIRAAAVTLPQWPEWIQQLRVSAERHLSVDLFCAGKLSGKHWDSTCLAWNLQNAWSGFPQDAQWAGPGELCVRLLEDKAHARPTPGHPNYKGIQKDLYKILVAVTYPDGMVSFVVTKISKLSPTASPNEWQVSEALRVLRSLRKHDAMCVLKTWTNSWSTSKRYHEDPIFPCLLGCSAGGIDDLEHYYQCPVLRAIVLHMFPDILSDVRLGRSLFESLFDNFGVYAVDVKVFKIMSCLFYAYHSIKSVRDSPLRSICFTDARVNFAGSLRAAAHDQALVAQEPDLSAIMLQHAA